MEIGRVAIALDSSELSMKAAVKGAELAEKFNAEVAVIYVLEVLKAIGSPELGYMASEVIQEARNEANEVLDVFCKQFKNLKITRYIQEGNPWEQILASSDAFKADLIMLGTHGRTGFTHLLMGSIAESVVQYSKIPVVVFPAKSLAD